MTKFIVIHTDNVHYILGKKFICVSIYACLHPSIIQKKNNESNWEK
jgi:hypothetical protein